MVVAEYRGHAAPMLTSERTALNFLQRLSGIATLTRQFVDAAAGRLFVEISRRDAPPKPDPEHRKIDSLTDREREIVAAATANAGANARAIAESLGISESTLRNHLTSIYSKLGVDSRLALFAYAHKHDLARPKS